MNPNTDDQQPQEPDVEETREVRYVFAQLAQDGQEVLIEHASHTYRLRLTKNDKLILTK